MTWNNVYLGNPAPVGNYQGSIATTTLSGLSVAGTANLGAVTSTGAFNSASAISGGAITGTTGTFTGAIGTDSAISGAALSATSGFFNDRLSVGSYYGGIGRPVTWLSGSSTTIVATTVTNQRSVTTTSADNRVQLGDIILPGPSNLSNGVVLQGFASANSVITWQYSNVSTANASQVAINCRYAVIRLLA